MASIRHWLIVAVASNDRKRLMASRLVSSELSIVAMAIAREVANLMIAMAPQYP
jgi:hypothetical protein